MLRVLIIAIVLFPIFSIVTLPIVLVGYVGGILNENIRYKAARLITYSASKILIFVGGGSITLKGLDHIPLNEPVLFVGNHKSFFDIPLLIQSVPFPVAFIAKDSLKKVPMLNIWMSMLGCLFLDRKNVRNSMKTIKKGINQLKRGHRVVIFPEGTRSKTENMLPFKQGSLKLAEKSNTLVVPFAIQGTDNLFENNHYRLKPAKISLSFGEPIDLSQLKEDAKRKKATYIQDKVQQLLSDSTK